MRLWGLGFRVPAWKFRVQGSRVLGYGVQTCRHRVGLRN